MTPTVTDNAERGRFEIHVDSELAGFAEYRGTDPRVFPHTVVAPRFGGRGLATELIRIALADARERGLKVVPACSFVADYLDSHPDDQDLVAR